MKLPSFNMREILKKFEVISIKRFGATDYENIKLDGAPVRKTRTPSLVWQYIINDDRKGKIKKCLNLIRWCYQSLRL